jgi:pimeloyl-ACP methyl ester carboxylesterase
MRDSTHAYLSTAWYRALAHKAREYGATTMQGDALFIASLPIQLLFYLGHTTLYPLRLITSLALFPAQCRNISIDEHSELNSFHQVREGYFITDDGIIISYKLLRSNNDQNPNNGERKLFIPFSGNNGRIHNYMDLGLLRRLRDYDILLFDMPRAGMNKDPAENENPTTRGQVEPSAAPSADIESQTSSEERGSLSDRSEQHDIVAFDMEPTAIGGNAPSNENLFTFIKHKIASILPVTKPHKLVNTGVAGIEEAIRLGYKQVELHGHSLGGSVAACACAQAQANSKIPDDVVLRLLLDRTFASLSKATEHFVASKKYFSCFSKPASWLVTLTGWDIRTEEAIKQIQYDITIHNNGKDDIIRIGASLVRSAAMLSNGNITRRTTQWDSLETDSTAHNESICFMGDGVPVRIEDSVLAKWLGQKQEPSPPLQR